MGQEQANRIHTTHSKPGNTKKIIVLAVVLGLLLLLAGVAATWYYHNYLSKEARARADFQVEINLIWQEVIRDSNGIKTILAKPTKESDLDKLNKNAATLEKSLKSKMSRLEKIKAPKDEVETKNKLKKGLENYIDYVSYLQTDVLYKNITNIKVPEDINDAQKYADKARDALAAFVDTSGFIKKRISNEAFDLHRLKDFIDNWQDQAAKEAEKKAEEAAAAAAAQRAAYEATIKQAAEQTALDFMNGLSGVYQSSPTELWVGAQRVADRYWTTASLNIFNSYYKVYFDDTLGRPTYTGGKVIQSEKISNSKFNVMAEEGERLDTAPDSPETKYLSYFMVEKVGAGWFITSHGKR